MCEDNGGGPWGAAGMGNLGIGGGSGTDGGSGADEKLGIKCGCLSKCSGTGIASILTCGYLALCLSK